MKVSADVNAIIGKGEASRAQGVYIEEKILNEKLFQNKLFCQGAWRRNNQTNES